MIHELKCSQKLWPHYKSGIKNSSVRKNDRGFSIGDTVVLRLWENDQFVIGQIVVKKITHVLYDFDFAPMPEGYCVLSLGEM